MTRFISPTPSRVKGASTLCTVALLLATSFGQTARAQSPEERFHDLFITAGYTTAFGAAIGTAFLAWTSDPAANLRYVAMGASLGFIGGSILGSYIIFSPVILSSRQEEPATLLSSGPLPNDGVVLRPHWDPENRKIAGVEGGLTLASF